ncbi:MULTISPECIES: recombinase family protein [unclassified Leptolyngbya]|uniref:recombinase family protein n=1 Tax=unclassified Leptolyngbya TaxID=2650499 RepID=UPI00168934A2|nr:MULTISPECIES: recombinase family protein [unclassified Leptolyngbya]MBD1910740.1 recombinase family protein [Leptolyngbya sp. FACHB-8]MBD2158241.1 recombinase family protein [Leptolyngbya sp. FACHB-16]
MNTAIYVRVSTQRQAQAQTIEQQLEQLQSYANRQGWQIAQEYIFRDDGYSGARLNRPGLDQLRDQVAMAQINRLLVLAPDRLARNFVHQTLLVEELQNRGCQVEFLERPMSQDPHDQLLLQIRGAVAEYERTLIAERMRRGRLSKLQSGTLLPWTVVPYGYRCSIEHPRDPAGVEINPAQAAVVREIFSRYGTEHISLVQLSWHLHELGIPSPTGKDYWTRSSLRSILKNPCYMGQVFSNRTRSCPAQQRRSALKPIGRKSSTRQQDRSEWLLVCQIPAIISQEQFDAAQMNLQHNQQFGKRNNKTHEYLLRTLVSCGHCQSSCFSCARGKGYRYYVCNRRIVAKHLEGNDKCNASYIPAQQLEKIVWNDICEILQHPESITQAIEQLQAGQWLPQELQARLAQLKQAENNLQQQLERLTQAYLVNVVQLDEYQRRRAQLESQIQASVVQQQQLTLQAHKKLEVANLAQGIEEFCQRVKTGLSQASFDQKRKLIELLIDRVIVTGNEVEIRYVMPTHARGETTHFCHLRLDYFYLVSQQTAS